MSVLKNRLDLITERSVLLQVLSDIEKNPYEYNYVVELFIEHLELFGKFLTPKEFTTRFQPILVGLNPLTAIIAFSKKLSSLQKNHTFRDVMTVLGWLKCVVEQKVAMVIVDSLTVMESDDETNQQFREFTAACINIPEKISNLRALATSNDHLKYISSVIWVIKHEILEGVQKALQAAHRNSSNEGNLKTISIFLTAGRNMEVENTTLLVKIMEWIEKLPKIDKKWKTIIKKLFMTPTEQGTQVHEALLTALFLSVKNEKQLERCIADTPIKSSGTLRRVVMVKLPFQRILEPWTMKLLVDFLYNDDEEHVFHLLETALKIWSDSEYARKCPETQEKHIVRMIVYCIHRLKKNLTPTWSDLFLSASQGVYTRMEMLPTYIRSALFLNATLAKLADSAVKNQNRQNPQNSDSNEMRPPEIKDYELDDAGNEWNEELKTILKKGILEVESEPKKSKNDSKKDDMTHIVQAAYVNPQKPPAPGPEFWKKPSTSAAPLDSDDEEDFPTYSVDDVERNFDKLKVGEEPRNKVQPPAYIVDAFEMLLEKEKMEVFEAAFFRLPYLIQRRSVGFAQIAENIVIRCLHLQNLFGTRNFDDTVEEIIIGCITNRPEIVPSLIKLFIREGQGDRIQQRLLHLILKAAEELGNAHWRHKAFVEQQQENMEKNFILAIHPYRDPEDEDDIDDEEEDEYPEWRRIVDARIAAKTRIISSRPREKAQNGINRLGQLGQYMFYPLLIVPKGENARLLHKDSDLLSLIIMVASMVFLRSGLNPSITGMATELICYVAPHRFSENSKVRAACLSAHLHVVALFPQELIVQIFPLEVRKSWREYAEHLLTASHGFPEETELATQLVQLLYNHLADQGVLEA